MNTRWSELRHAYGPAGDIPALLESARSDTRPGHEPETPWFKLWSALCHQGDTYTAAYAALPQLVEIARLARFRGRYDPLLLAGCIELARLEGKGPDVPEDLVAEYTRALKEAAALAREELRSAGDDDSVKAFSASVAVFAGDSAGARKILDGDD